MSRKNILILDPERDTAELFARALESHDRGCKCYWVDTPAKARSLLSEIGFSILLADLGALRDDRFRLFESLHEMGCHTLVIVDGYINEKENVKEAMNLGASGYFIKPIMIKSLRKLIDDVSQRATA